MLMNRAEFAAAVAWLDFHVAAFPPLDQAGDRQVELNGVGRPRGCGDRFVGPGIQRGRKSPRPA